jgi:hypothetical protein
MSDFSKLKKLAEDYIRLIDDPDEDLWAEARDMYDDASDVDTVLALIKENESLRELLSRARGYMYPSDPLRNLINATLISSPENP